VIGRKVAFEHFHARAALKADDVVGKDRFFDINRRFGLDWFGRCLPNRGKGLMNVADQARKLVY
jgi:hypothetical protein